MNKIFRILLFSGTVLWLSACTKGSDEKKTGEMSSKLPIMAMIDSSSYNFGTIKEGEVVEHSFRFRNDGEFPLILNNITSSCGCTTPEWPKDPIEPKAESSIKVRFDSKNKVGPQVKTITVYANTDPAYSELRLRGIVEGAPKEADK